MSRPFQILIFSKTRTIKHCCLQRIAEYPMLLWTSRLFLLHRTQSHVPPPTTRQMPFSSSDPIVFVNDHSPTSGFTRKMSHLMVMARSAPGSPVSCLTSLCLKPAIARTQHLSSQPAPLSAYPAVTAIFRPPALAKHGLFWHVPPQVLCEQLDCIRVP